MAIIINRTISLDKPIQVENLNGSTFTNESGGHKFVVTCTQNGDFLPLTGSLSARFLRADNNTILLGNGASDTEHENNAVIRADGKAEVTLHQDCYNVRGRFQLAIFHIDTDGSKTCIYACVGSVNASQSGRLIDSGDVISTVDDLIQAIHDAEESIPPDYSTLTNGVVRHDIAQSLNDTQKSQARTNIAAASKSDMDKVLDASETATRTVNITANKAIATDKAVLNVDIPAGVEWTFRVDSSVDNAVSVCSLYYRVAGDSDFTKIAFDPEEEGEGVNKRKIGKTYTIVAPIGGIDAVTMYAAAGNVLATAVLTMTVAYALGANTLESQVREHDTTISGLVGTTGDLSDRMDSAEDIFLRNGFKKIEFTRLHRFYPTTIGETVDLTTPTTSSNFRCTAIECSEGDLFTVEGYGGSANSRPWAFLDSSNIVISAADKNECVFEQVVAPENAVILILNNRYAGSTGHPDAISYYGMNLNSLVHTDETLDARISTAEDAISVIESKELVDQSAVKEDANYKYHFDWKIGGFSVADSEWKDTSVYTYRRSIYPAVTAERDFTVVLASGYKANYGIYNGDVRTNVPQTPNPYKISAGTVFDMTVVAETESASLDTEHVYDCDQFRAVSFVTSGLPAYWDSAITSAELKILANSLSCYNGDEFFFVTDQHWRGSNSTRNSTQLIHKLRDDLGIRKVICGGDYIASSATDAQSAQTEIYDYFRTFDHDDLVFATIGNHDLNVTSGWDINKAYSAITRRNEYVGVSDPVTGCSYMDNVGQKIRYIQFPFDGKNKINYSATINNKVIEWFKELSADWTVILVSHGFWDGTENDDGITSTIHGNDAKYYARHFLDIQNNETATIACWIVGHCHRDIYAIVSPAEDGSIVSIATSDSTSGTATSGQLLVIATNTDGGTPMGTPNHNPATMRTKATDTEQAFDVYQLDKTNRHLYLTRIGLGNDREFGY